MNANIVACSAVKYGVPGLGDLGGEAGILKEMFPYFLGGEY